MTTGDLRNNLRKLQSELKAINYTRDVDFESLGNGNTADFLPIYHYVFIEYSRPLSAKIVEINVEMFGKTDLRFIEAVYKTKTEGDSVLRLDTPNLNQNEAAAANLINASDKVLCDMFTYKPPVTKLQFFAPGFGERKVIMCTQVLQLMRVKHQSLLQSTRGASGRRHHSQPSPSEISSSHPLIVSGEVSSKALQHTATKSDHLATGEVTTSVVPLVVNEVRCKPVGGETTVGRDMADAVLPTVAYPISDDRRRQADDVIKNTLLEALSKINDSVEQISSRLGTLDHRLARLESLEQQLTRFNRLEARIGDVEDTVSRKKLPVETGHEFHNADAMSLVTSQLNNLVARMTLVENKLIMLQSTEVTVAQGTNAKNRSSNMPSAPSYSRNHNTDADDCQDQGLDDCQDQSFDVQPTVISDSYAVPSAAVEHELDAKSSRSEQLSRIEAMLRGTKEMLTGSSGNVPDKSSPILT